MYKVIWAKEALDYLGTINQVISKKIKQKVETYLSIAPHELGEQLKGDFKGLYRYRFSNYRVIYNIKDDLVLIDVISVGHRRNIYKK